MGRTWKKYLNKQKYSECQLVTAINACYYLTGKTIEQDSDEYEELVDLVAARNGSAICIEKAYEKLGLKVLGQYRSIYSFEQIKTRKIPLPMEVGIWHKKTGFHSILIVDHCLKTDCYRVANFRYQTSLEGWMFAEDLYQFERDMNKGWIYRLFGKE